MKILHVMAVVIMPLAQLFSVDDPILQKFKTVMSDQKVTSLADLKAAIPEIQIYEGVFVLGGWIPLDWDFTKGELPIRANFNDKKTIIAYLKIDNKRKVGNNDDLNKSLTDIIVKDNYSICIKDQIHWYVGKEWKSTSMGK